MEDNTSDLTTCPVCFERYTETGEHVPRLLPCHCTLCARCIETLINAKKLVCPQDRRTHPADNGVKSFCQNKYILSFLKRDWVAQGADHDGMAECSTHKGMKIALFCTESDCNRGICTVCMTENHLTHRFINNLERNKSCLHEKVKQLRIDLQTQTERIRKAKTDVEQECDRIVKAAQERKNQLNEEFDSAAEDCKDHLANLTYIEDTILSCKSHAEVAHKTDFVNTIDQVLSTKPVRYRCLKLQETDESVDDVDLTQRDGEDKRDSDDAANAKPNEAKTGPPFEILDSFPTDLNQVFAALVLLDGSVLLYGVSGTVRALQQWSLDTHQTLFRKRVTNGGMTFTDVEFNGQQCVVLSYSVAGRFDLCHNPDVYRVVQTFSSGNDLLGQPYRVSRNAVVYQQGSQWQCIDCSRPTLNVLSFDTSRYSHPSGCDVFCAIGTSSHLILVASRTGALAAHEGQYKKLWSISGAIGELDKELDIRSVTADKSVKFIAAADRANRRVLLFSSDGSYRGTLLKQEEAGLGELQFIRWCEKNSHLVVFHKKGQNIHVTAIKPKLDWKI